jgi:hypothetical protein
MKALKQSLPTYYRIPALDGYDPVIETTQPFWETRKQLRRDPVRTAEALGVRWLLCGDLKPEPSWPVGTVNLGFTGTSPRLPWQQYSRQMAAKLRAAGKPRLELDGLEVWELPRPDALAFWQSHPKDPLTLHWWPDRMEIDTGGQPANEKLVVNFLWRKQWHAFAGERELPVEEDSWQRMVIGVPTDAAAVTLRYQPPWQRALLLGGGLEAAAILASVVLPFLLRRKRSEAPAEQAAALATP